VEASKTAATKASGVDVNGVFDSASDYMSWSMVSGLGW